MISLVRFPSLVLSLLRKKRRKRKCLIKTWMLMILSIEKELAGGKKQLIITITNQTCHHKVLQEIKMEDRWLKVISPRKMNSKLK